MPKNIFTLLLILLFILTTTILFFIPSNLNSSSLNQTRQPEVKSTRHSETTVENVPELNQILNGDQDTRLKAARRLAERVDVQAALEILNDSSLPRTGEGHLAVHQIGFHAYEKHGLDSILLCKDYFLYACYHGAIIEASSDQGFEAISKMADRCKESSGRYFQCAHAAGHAIVAIWDYDLPNALNTCDSIFEKQAEFPESLSSCHNGAFMENLFGVHDWGVEEIPKRDWLSDDMFFPCNAFGEKYQKGCWLNQAARIYQMYKGDIVKTANTCQRIGHQQYTIWCMDSLARQIHAATNGDTTKVFSLCQLVGNYWRENCIIVNAGSYYSVGGKDEAIEVCNKIIPPAKNPCYQNIIGQLISDDLKPKEKEVLCGKMEDSFEKQCLWQIKI